LAQLFRMYYQYGYFKPLVARKVGRVMTVRQLVPALLVASVATFASLSLWLPAARGWLFLLVSLYGSLVVVFALSALPRHGLPCAIALPVVFPTLHFSYGIGFLVGTWDHLLARRFTRPKAFGLSR
jgi:hypothetical protein